MRERKRSSLSRMEASASSFCSMVAPAMRMMKKRTKAPITAMALASQVESFDGATPCQMATWPAMIPNMLQKAVILHDREPPWATFSRASRP